MSDTFTICLLSLHKLGRKFVTQLKALSSKLSRWNRTQPKRMLPSFPAMEVTNQLKQVFDFFDANDDGKISHLELREVLLRLGHEKYAAAKEAKGMVREIDRNGDGFVDIDEFRDVVKIENEDGGPGFGKEEGVGDDDDLRGAFMMFDLDKNGFTSAKELKRVMIRLGCSNCSIGRCREMIRGVDRDGNGLVDFEEFRSMMRTGLPC